MSRPLRPRGKRAGSAGAGWVNQEAGESWLLVGRRGGWQVSYEEDSD